ncbi:MarR family transcriptional regulator [Hylemonella gracilis str. Niagara R]|uniref:MarR family transcriptional regulator n=2 Tax=Hylemonella gracilis TaxID=80880 RepID=A0A016XH10_9BURK|nr:MarR family transcriptional regulator [Hylemonella gracilis str. Niagara R]
MGQQDMTSKKKAISDEQLASLADAVLELARKLDIRHPELHGLPPLTGTEVAVIRDVHARPHATPSQIADATGLQRSNVSTALRALEARGLVQREAAEGNARNVEVVPTDLAVEGIRRIKAYWSQRLRQAEESDLAAALAALETLARIADAIDVES